MLISIHVHGNSFCYRHTGSLTTGCLGLEQHEEYCQTAGWQAPGETGLLQEEETVGDEKGV